MALTAKKSPGRFWSRLHFLVLFTLLTGLLVAAAGGVWAMLDGRLTEPALRQAWADVQAGLGLPPSLWPLVGGAAAALLALLIEALVFLRQAAGRRSVFGANAMLQVALAAVLLVGVNVYSFRHYVRLDTTRDQQFTLPADLQAQLRQLRLEVGRETRIVVYQRHKTFGNLTDKPDDRDYEAGRKVVEKVNDLADQFRELGPQFRVRVLDATAKGFDKQLEEETADAPDLRAAIDGAAENSIFFYAGPGRLQRMTFGEFYALDKTASQEQGNLVLLFQGVEPFARKVLNIDEKRPKVAVGVIHDLLSTEGTGDYGMPGLKKSLNSHGIDVEDVILKKSRGFSLLGAGVYTYAESRFDRLENETKTLDAEVKALSEMIDKNAGLRKEWATATLKDLTQKYAARLRVKQVSEEMRRFQLTGIDEVLQAQREDRDELRKALEKRRDERAGLNVESAAELQRMTDLRAKMDRLLADCDLLVIPRMTLRNLNLGEAIPNRVYRLDDAQADAIKDFLKKGKPVLVCFGPANEPPQMRPDPTAEGPDNVEQLLAELGIHFGKTAVLFDVESAALSGSSPGQEQVLGANVEVPPVDFAWKGGDAWPPGQASAAKGPNPVRAAMLLAARGAGRELDLRLRHPRPVYFEPEGGDPLPYDPTLMVTSPAAWNEDQPFPTEDHVPHFEATAAASAVPQSRDEKRHGRFSVGVVAQARVPATWYDSSKDASPATVRVVAIGHGGVFVGQRLSPATEALLLNSCNWLLGRDDRLPRTDRPWSYPRVALDAREIELWHWGTQVGLPALFLYLGLVVLLFRQLR
jgi:hypothetical protein